MFTFVEVDNQSKLEITEDTIPRDHELPALRCKDIANDPTRHWTHLDQIDIARLRVQIALDELETMLKTERLNALTTIATGRQLADNQANHRSNSFNTTQNRHNDNLRKRCTNEDKEMVFVKQSPNRQGEGKTTSSTTTSSARKRPYSIRRNLSTRTRDTSRCGGRSSLNEVDYCSRYVFPIAFILFVVVYWTALIYYK